MGITSIIGDVAGAASQGAGAIPKILGSSSGARAFTRIRDVAGAVKDNRSYTYRRRRMLWEVPYQTAFVEMYLNPQNIDIKSQKLISQQRAKGGYIVQYWGEELDEMTLTGITGARGIEGIRILKKVYRSEQQKKENLIIDLKNTLIGRGLGSISAAELSNIVSGTSTRLLDLRDSKSKVRTLLLDSDQIKSLAQLATGVTCHFQGESYKGFFTDFSYNESTGRLGIYEYTATFKITRTLGGRRNWAPWSKSQNQDSQYFASFNKRLFNLTGARLDLKQVGSRTMLNQLTG